jgi:hypothetical protein
MPGNLPGPDDYFNDPIARQFIHQLDSLTGDQGENILSDYPAVVATLVNEYHLSDLSDPLADREGSRSLVEICTVILSEVAHASHIGAARLDPRTAVSVARAALRTIESHEGFNRANDIDVGEADLAVVENDQVADLGIQDMDRSEIAHVTDHLRFDTLSAAELANLALEVDQHASDHGGGDGDGAGGDGGGGAGASGAGDDEEEREREREDQREKDGHDHGHGGER